jgi:ketosteroid isomerase-like protein
MIADVPVTRVESTTPIGVAARFSEVWAAGDFDRAMEFVAENCVYALYISGELLPVGGETRGKPGIEAGLRQVRRDFDYLLYRPLEMREKGDEVRYQVEFMYRHVRSGEILSGRFRMIMRIEDGKILRADEYHDRAKVEAFLRLFTT